MKFTAEPGKRYRAHIKLGVFEQVVSNAGLMDRLLAVGLQNVSVEGSGRERWAFGEWHGVTSTVDLPSQIIAVDAV